MTTAYFFRFGAPGKLALDSILKAHVPGLFCHSSYMIGDASAAHPYRQEKKYGVLVATSEAATLLKMFVTPMGNAGKDDVAVHSILPIEITPHVRNTVLYTGNHKDRATDTFPWEMFGTQQQATIRANDDPYLLLREIRNALMGAAWDIRPEVLSKNSDGTTVLTAWLQDDFASLLKTLAPHLVTVMETA